MLGGASAPFFFVQTFLRQGHRSRRSETGRKKPPFWEGGFLIGRDFRAANIPSIPTEGVLVNAVTPIKSARVAPNYLIQAISVIVQSSIPTKEIHFSEDSEIHTETPMGYQPLEPKYTVTRADIETLMEFAAEGKYDHKARIAEKGHYDESLTCHNRRLRCNFYRAQGKLSASIRTLPSVIPNYDELKGPEHLRRLVDRSTAGLVLITGPVGVGKSTTSAALIEHLNQTRGGHILTLEDPVEYLYTPKLARISQRSVGENCDVPTFTDGLIAAKRQNASVIQVGELRDRETVRTALQAAESGSLVFASTHAASAGDTIETLMSYFDAVEHEHIRNVLARTIRAICSQRLVASTDKKNYVLAYEYVARSPAIVKMIRDNAISQLRRAVEDQGGSDGTTSLNYSLKALVDSNTISTDEAMRKSHNKEGLASLLNIPQDDYV